MDVSLFKDVKRIITHGGCPDGMGSAVMLHCVFSDIEPEFYHHKQPEYLNLVPEEGMLFCDIIPPEHRAEEFVPYNPVVLDHHKGVEHIVAMYGERGVFADEKKEPGVSGTTLAFREIFAPSINERGNEGALRKASEFARLAGIRDTWQKKDPDWEKACHQAAMLTFYPWEHFSSNSYSEIFGLSYEAFPDEMKVGENIYAKRMRDAKKCLNNSVVFRSNGYKVAVFNDPDKLCSDVAEMHRQNHTADVIAGFYYVDDGEGTNIIYSMRCNQLFNVQEMASALGGGGHTKAAGFSITMNIEDVNPFLRFKELFDDYVENNGWARL
jgi:oligoribonuclease NrnB/cAMP/cGMP phosphodiesterase (DHH superfamily)